MTAWLIGLLKARWQYLVVGLLVAATLAYTYHQGRVHGRAVAELDCARIQQERDKQDAAALIRWTAHLDYIEQQRRAAVKRAEEIPVKIVEKFLPGKEVIRHEIREVPVYSECRISVSVYDQLTAALSGRPASTGVPSP